MELWLKGSPTAISKSPKKSIGSAAMTKFEHLAAQGFKRTIQMKSKVRNKKYTQVYKKEKFLMNKATETCCHSRGTILKKWIG